MVFEELVFVVRRFVPECRAKYSFTGRVPYIVCNISEPRFAKMFVDQYRADNRNDHHSNTLSIADAYLHDIEAIANGDVSSIPVGLLEEQAVYRRCPLSSQKAEGYHRTTRLSKIRGAAARIPWIFAK